LLRLAKIAQAVLSALLLVGAIAYVTSQAAWTQILSAISNLSWFAIVAATLLMAAGAMLASLRLWYISRDLGYHLTFRDAVSALGLGQVAGVLFFQIAGQLMARSAFLSRRSVPVAGTVIVTGYERLSALAVSLILAIGAAIYLFGKISINAAEGGLLPIKILLGLLVATIGGARLSWGHLIEKNFTLSASTYYSLTRNLALSFAIQIFTMATYVLLARAIAPHIPLLSLIAASALVMFTASLPISFAGWGMREMSAIFALGAIGVSAERSFTVAATVGLISLLVVGLMATMAIGHPPHFDTNQSQPSNRPLPLDHAAILEYALAILAATAVFFQVFVPINKGLVNVNLADPAAILAGSLFVLNYYFGRRWPQWRTPHVNLYFGLLTSLIAVSFLHGLYSFGLTNWAFANRFIGWFVILAYTATGALIIKRARYDGLELLLRTFASVAISVVALELVLLLIYQFGGDFVQAFVELPFIGFSENRNAFAFLLLLAGCVVLPARWKHSAIMLGIILTGIWFSGSRAVFVALPVVIVVAAYMRCLKLRMLLEALTLATIVALLVTFGPMIINRLISLIPGIPGTPGISGALQIPSRGDILAIIISPPASNAERIKSLSEGWAMFTAHPIFGAGLGAFMHQSMQAGTPLVIHSTPLWLLAEMGLLGFIIILIPALRIFWIEIRNPANADFGGSVLVFILTAFAVMSNAHDIMYQRAFWLLLGATLAYVPKNLDFKRH
jgi:uncharacterized membrane protein YbhN (UPF0104 family)